VTGALLASWWIDCCNEKLLLTASMLLSVGMIVMFCNTDIYALLLISRLVTGACQVFFSIYMPLWADVYGTESSKSCMMTLLLISSPLGIIMGYGLTAWMMVHYTWKIAMYA
jgi:predicted MFS family arabinose efflux permease